MTGLFTMQINFPKLPPQALVLALAGLAIASPVPAAPQEPSASLKQADADYREGLAVLNRNDLKTAQAKFEDVVRLAPSAQQGHSALGAVLEREGQAPEPNRGVPEGRSHQAHRHRGAVESGGCVRSNRSPGQSNSALFKSSRGRAGAEAPHRGWCAGFLRARLAGAGKPDAAIARMKEVVALQPRDPQLHDDLGSLYAQSQDWAHAEEEFSEAIRLKPNFAEAHLHLGFVLQAEQKSNAAQEWLQACKLEPENANLALVAGKALADAGQDREAEPILERAHKLLPQSTAAAYQLALVLQRADRLDEATPLFKSVVEAEPDNADALVNFGLALTQAHEARDAVPFLQRAIALQPANVTAHLNLAAAYLQVNETDDAIVELQAALKLAPDSPQLHYNLGAAYKIEDDAAHAIPELETAAKLDPARYEPNYLLGVLYMQEAHYDEAASRLEASLNCIRRMETRGQLWAASTTSSIACRRQVQHSAKPSSSCPIKLIRT